jgi:hypothetical protein
MSTETRGPIASNDDFKAAVARYAADNGIKGSTALGAHLGVPRGTAGQWLNLGLLSEKGRKKVVEQYPHVFEGERSERRQGDRRSGPEPPGELPVPAQGNREFLVLVKTEAVRSYSLVLGELLRWFLFEATEAERNELRDSLGDDWKEFLERTRAMTGETAFKMARDEGRLR